MQGIERVIDLVEEREGRLFGYEIKWKNERVKVPGLWASAYPDATFDVIHRENYLKFIQ